MLSLAPGLASQGPIDWVYYSPQALAAVEAEGKVALIDFTAEWCLNCKTLEKSVLHRPEIIKLLDDPKVVPIKVDLTGNNPAGRQLLPGHGIGGHPVSCGAGAGHEVSERQAHLRQLHGKRGQRSLAQGGRRLI